MTFDFQLFHGEKLIRGINKLKLLLEFLCFSFPPVLYFFKKKSELTARTLKSNNFISFDILGNISLPFEIII